MKKQKKLTALIMSVIMVFAATSAMSVATFAWFTRGTEAAASGFDFTASAASGIQISTNASDWSSTITDTDFDLTPGQPQENSRLSIANMEPVSTVDSLSGGNYSFFGATSGDGDFALAADSTNFLVFDLYFMNAGADDLTLSLSASAAVTDGSNDKDASLTTRVGFVVEGSHDVPATVIGMAGGVSSYIWEPNSTTRSASAISAGAFDSAKYNYNGINGNNGGTAVSDTDAYNFLNANGAYTAPVTTTNDYTIGDTPAIGTLPGQAGGQITKIKVFVWMEGQDVDCNNSVSEGDVDIALAFDSGATVAKALAAKTATSLTTPVATTEVAVSGTGALGVTYTAFVFEDKTDAAVSLDYRLYLSTGAATHAGSDITIISLSTNVTASATYNVVVVADLLGYVGSRTSTNLSI